MAAVVMITLLQNGAAAQEPADAAMVAAIRAEELNHSAASDLFYTLTDVLGPRLSGSPAYDKAAHWALDRFRQWGLANPQLEPFKFGRGWTLEKLTLEMTAPRYMPTPGIRRGLVAVDLGSPDREPRSMSATAPSRKSMRSVAASAMLLC